jgi:hypothetical protein
MPPFEAVRFALVPPNDNGTTPLKAEEGYPVQF